ncbi:MAG: hypothetical protein JWO04_1519 [Gammaproteobacteria bacterium]|nr:hypothetical protein [Gammaproteobacteria bacterium]
MSEQTVPVIGFVGLGVMGGPMCRNIAAAMIVGTSIFGSSNGSFHSPPIAVQRSGVIHTYSR